jgi:cytochrome c oxidase subunit 2
VAIALGLATIALGAAGCVPTPATAEGREIASLYSLFLGAAAVVAVIVVGSTTWAILRYRRRTDELPRQTYGNTRLEAIWTLLPAVTVVVLFVAGFLVLLRLESRAATPGAEVEVTAYRWGWSFTYPTADVTISGIGQPGPEVVLPVDEPIRVRLTGADVIHSFYVPEFLFKRDANPGRITEFEFTIEEEGTYRGQCAEFCGVYHARMPFSIVAVPRAEYDAWLAANADGAGESPAADDAPAGASPSP